MAQVKRARPKRRRGGSCVWILFAVLAAPTIGSSAVTQSATAQTLSRTTISASRTVKIDVSGAELIELSEEIGTAFLADPSIADIQPPKPSSLFCSARSPAGRPSSS